MPSHHILDAFGRPEKKTISLYYTALSNDLQLEPSLYCGFIYRSGCQSHFPHTRSVQRYTFNQNATSPGHSLTNPSSSIASTSTTILHNAEEAFLLFNHRVFIRQTDTIFQNVWSAYLRNGSMFVCLGNGGDLSVCLYRLPRHFTSLGTKRQVAWYT
jgi:hypothetical protein